jgi:hypothetical protein
MQKTPAAVNNDTTRPPPPPVIRKKADLSASAPVLQVRQEKPLPSSLQVPTMSPAPPGGPATPRSPFSTTSLFPEYEHYDAAPVKAMNKDVPASTGGVAASSNDSGMSACTTTTSSIGSSTTTTSTTTTTTLPGAAMEERAKDKPRKVKKEATEKKQATAKKQATEKKKMYRRSLEFFAPKNVETPTSEDIKKAENRALYDAFNENKEQIARLIGDPYACALLHDPMRVLIDAGTNRFWIALEKMLQESPLSALSLSHLGNEMHLSALPRKLEYFLRQIGGVANLVVATKLEEVQLTDDTGAKFV